MASAAPYPKRLYFGQPGTTASTVYTAPTLSSNMTAIGSAVALSTALVKGIWLINTTATAANVTIGINGVAVANQIVPNVSVKANDAAVIEYLDGIQLQAGDTIQVLQGTTNAITVIIGGVEIQ